MDLRGCSCSHFIWTIQDGVMKRVHNTDSLGRPGLKFKKLEDLFQSADAERTPLTLSQLRKKCKSKKRKASESVLLTPKVEDDDPDLSEPLCNFRVTVSKCSPTKTTLTNGSSPTSPRKDLATVNVKVEAPDMEYFECKDTTLMDNNTLFCNPSADSIASEARFAVFTHEEESKESGFFTNDGEICGFNEVPVYNLEDMESDSEEVGYICGAQDLESTIGDDHYGVDLTQSSDLYTVESETQEYEFPTTIPDEHDADGVSMELKSPIREEKQDLTSVNTGADLNSLISDNNSSDSKDVFILQDHPSLVPANVDSEVKLFDHNHQTDVLNEASEVRNSHCVETRFPERFPLTRKAISPNSQEILRLAMKSAQLSDDVERYKCKEKLNFEEQNENKFSSTTSDIKDNEPNLQRQQATPLSQNKFFISSKQLLKRPKNYRKGSPPKSFTPKGCLDGPRLCRSLPRLSTGCTSIQVCSESAIAFSERQMHDIESLASKLMSELNSMKVMVENKLLYEAYRSTPLNNEADEVKSAIKSVTKTEETARKWLSMMARDCNRFCKIMKLNQDPSASVDPTLGSTNKEKPLPLPLPLQRERKKISFTDEAGGTLCTYP